MALSPKNNAYDQVSFVKNQSTIAQVLIANTILGSQIVSATLSPRILYSDNFDYLSPFWKAKKMFVKVPNLRKISPIYQKEGE